MHSLRFNAAQTVALDEDRTLRGFMPLAAAQAHIRFTDHSSDEVQVCLALLCMVIDAAQTKERCICLVKFALALVRQYPAAESPFHFANGTFDSGPAKPSINAEMPSADVSAPVPASIALDVSDNKGTVSQRLFNSTDGAAHHSGSSAVPATNSAQPKQSMASPPSADRSSGEVHVAAVVPSLSPSETPVRAVPAILPSLDDSPTAQHASDDDVDDVVVYQARSHASQSLRPRCVPADTSALDQSGMMAIS